MLVISKLAFLFLLNIGIFNFFQLGQLTIVKRNEFTRVSDKFFFFNEDLCILFLSVGYNVRS